MNTAEIVNEVRQSKRTVHIVRKAEPTVALCGDTVEAIIEIGRREDHVWYCMTCEDIATVRKEAAGGSVEGMKASA